MSFEEKLAAQGRKMDETKAKLEEAINARKQVRQQTREELAAEIVKLDAAYDEFEAALDAQVDKQIGKLDAALDLAEEQHEKNIAKVKAAFTLDKADAEAVANEPTQIDQIEAATAEQIARVKGDVAAAEENARLIHEYRSSKREALKLRAQMKVNNAKDKIAARKESFDKAEEEAWILDLMTYAEGCYDMAYAWAMEAEYTLMEAAYELEYYKEKYGEKE